MSTAAAHGHRGTVSFRPDIEGLRGLAVLAVILYHYGVPGFRGGLVGVDVFFVISGYLIAGGIQGDLAAGRFSLAAFYERRMRRILPALFVMLGLTLVLSALVQFPPDLHFETRIEAYVIPLFANFKLYQTAGAYGSEFAGQIPLLHTWSIGVEEQFYLVFPLLMVGIYFFVRRCYAPALGVVASVSFALCLIGARMLPLETFYLPLFRAWELLCGALLAVHQLPAPQRPPARAAWALLGLLLIGIAVVIINDATAFPSEWALLPCLGTAAILYAGARRDDPGMGLWLNRPQRLVGRWSYSLYLYHWPVLVLARYFAFGEVSLPTLCVLLALTFVLAGASYRFVEQPFRGPNAVLDRTPFLGAVTASALVLFAATALAHSLSDPRAYSARDRRLFVPDTVQQIRCKNTSPEDTTHAPCVLGDPTRPVTALFWGDSHALALLPAVDDAFARHHRSVMFSESGGCAPLLGVHVRDYFAAQSQTLLTWLDSAGLGKAEFCKRRSDAMLRWISEHPIDTVILAAHWVAYTDKHNFRRLTDARSPRNYTMDDNGAVFTRGLDRLLDELDRRHVQVYLVEDVPECTIRPPYALASAQRLGLEINACISEAGYEEQQRDATQIFLQLQQRHPLKLLRPQPYLCDRGLCAIRHQDECLYNDQEHMSAYGAAVVEPVLESVWQLG